LISLILAVVTVAGCERDRGEYLCDKAVKHVLTGMIPPGSEPGENEKAIMDVTVSMTLAKCRAEGLSQAQADCIMAVQTIDQLLHLGECPAIAADRPSWLILPSPEALELLDQKKRNAQPSPDERPAESPLSDPPSDSPSEPPSAGSSSGPGT
ncbi:MAG: hypothetical protein AAGC55_00395, partial [Myxococcota bacterium]